MYNLFLDDFRSPEDVFNYTGQPLYLMNKWIIVRNYEEFVKAITELGVPDTVSFDHDLADVHYDVQDHVDEDYYDLMSAQNEKTGYHCAQYLLNHCLDNELDIPKVVWIHSMNGPGAKNIDSLFTTYKKVHGK